MQNRLVLVLVSLAFAFGAAALVGPWWVLTTGPTAGPPDLTIGYGPFGTSITPSSPSTVYQTITLQSNSTAIPAYQFVFLGGVGLMTVGLLAAVAMAMLVLAPASSPARRRIVSLGFLAFLLFVAAAAEVAILLPVAMDFRTGGGGGIATFWGSQVVGPSPGLVTWGAGWGWYSAVAAAVVFLFAALSWARANRREVPVAPPPSA